MKRQDGTDFDVIVVGTGISGTIISSILARQGHSVLMLDEGSHPRYTIGESTIPQTSQLIQLLSRDYDVPELAVLGLKAPKAIREQIAPTSGIKRIFGFAYHHVGQEHDPKLAHQFGNVWRDENHLFRQDIDTWLFNLALKYGCQQRQSVKIESVETDASGARVALADGQRFTAKFVIDGSGHKSLLAAKFGLRDNPCQMVSNTRSLFTHMIGVKEFEEVAPTCMTHPWKVGTLHHLFKRGWFWVIPFNNWEGSTNPLVSVGVTVDDREYPLDPKLDIEEEFCQFLERLPSVKKQFENAQSVRPWVRSRRIQYSSKRTIGPRFALLSHTAGFVDPLFSRGLISTMENIRELLEVLLPALKDGDFTESRFEPVDVQQKLALGFADKMVRAAYASWDDFELWNLWVRVWAIGVHAAESGLGSILTMGKASAFRPVENPIFSRYEPAGFRQYFEQSYQAMCDFDEGRCNAEDTRQRMLQILTAYDFEIPLRNKAMGHEWAMKQPLCRDIFLGIDENHMRWQQHVTDAHLMG
jgi:tetracycline 7-halogenase / FADH2 O2-dependent halogenase